MFQGGLHLPREVENNSLCKVKAGGKTESIIGRRLDQGATYVCMKECGMRGFGALNLSPHSCASLSVPLSSHSRIYLIFTSATFRMPVDTALKSDTEPIRYVTLHFRDRRGAVSLRPRNCTEITVLMSKQNPHPEWFSCRRKNSAVWCKN